MNSKVLVLNGSHSELPYILELKSRGYYVITAGTDKQAIGNSYADEHVCVDYSNVEAIKEQIIQKQIGLLFPCCNDFSMFTCSSLKKDVLNGWAFDEIDITEKIHLKDEFKQYFKQNDLPVTLGLGFSSKQHAVSFIINNLKKPQTYIVKPTDLSGGKGIGRLNNQGFEAQIAVAFDLSKTKQIVIEEFFEGTNHGCCAFVEQGVLVFSFLDTEYYSDSNPYKVLGTLSDNNITSELRSRINLEIERIVEIFNIQQGYLHFQLKISFDKETFVFLEMCRRPPGDLHSVFVEYCTGLPIVKWIVDSFINKNSSCNISSHNIENNRVLRHTNTSEELNFHSIKLSRIPDTMYTMVNTIEFYNF